MNDNLAHPQITFRDTTTGDVPALIEFLEPFFDAHIIRRTEKEMETLSRHGFLALSGNKIVGFAAIEIYSQKLAEVQSLAVDSEYQRQGIGKQLVNRCVERSNREGILELMAITASEKLFRDIGFDYSLPNQKRAFFLQTRGTTEQEE